MECAEPHGRAAQQTILITEKTTIMKPKKETKITVENTVNAPTETVWELWNGARHIEKWNSPSEDWHCPKAENDLKVGGKLKSRMEAKDGSMGFDFEGIYDTVENPNRVAYTMSDGRKVKIEFSKEGNQTKVSETFDPEEINSHEMQQSGWQAILDNFKKYAESSSVQ